MKRKSDNRKTLSLFWQFTKPDKWYFITGTLGAALGIIAQDIIPPFIISRAFDRLQKLYASGQPLAFSDFSHYIIWYIAFLILGIILWRTQVILVWRYQIRAIQRIMERLFDHLQHQDSKFHADRFGGALVSQANKFAGAYERITDEFTWSITTGIVAFVTSVGLLIKVAPFYGLVLLFVCILYFCMMLWRMKKQMPFDRKLAQSESDRTAKIADMITNVGTVTAFAGEEQERKLFKKQASETSRAYWKLLNMHWINDTISHFSVSTMSIMAFTIGIVGVTVFKEPVGVLYLTLTYTMALTRRLWESSRVLRNVNRGFGDAYDMTEILGIKQGIPDMPEAPQLKASRGSIAFDNVGFYYPEQADDSLFDGLNLKIKPGEKVGLVGHSGSGKTTLSKLLLRFMDIQEGSICIDDQNIAEVTQTSLRKNVAYVSQEPLLFHRSLADNIGYGQPGADKKTIMAVAKMAHAHDFIQKLPQGYDTMVGERGVKLSGGQRQRVAIARAMIKNAPILVLDEATSALDSESEGLIQDALWKLMEGRTAIVIAHRLSTIQKMDRIIVLEDGKIVEQGSHKELIRSKGAYADLWNHQSGGFMED